MTCMLTGGRQGHDPSSVAQEAELKSGHGTASQMFNPNRRPADWVGSFRTEIIIQESFWLKGNSYQEEARAVMCSMARISFHPPTNWQETHG